MHPSNLLCSGVLERLKGFIEQVKSMPQDEVEANNNSDAICMEDDFHPVSESSRISSGCDSILSREAASSPCPPLNIDEGDVSKSSSLQDDASKTSSRRASVITPRPVSPVIPPQSPRTIVEEPSRDKSPFYLDKNIDQIPERNVSSPREKPVKVSVIKFAQGGGSQPVKTVVEEVISPRTPKLLSTSSRDLPSPQVSPYLASCFITSVSPAVGNLTTLQGPSIGNETNQSDMSAASAAGNPTNFPSLSVGNQSSLASFLENEAQVEAEESSLSSSAAKPLVTTIPPFHILRSRTPVLDSAYVDCIQEFFAELPDSQATKDSCFSILLQVHPYLNSTIFKACYQSEEKGGCSQFISFVQSNSRVLYDTNDSVKAFNLLRGCQKRNYLMPEDFKPLLQTYIQDNHQVEFFRQDQYSSLTEFYITSMTASMFFSVGAWRTRRMYWRQFLKLELWKLLEQLDMNVDNAFIDHISYDQFYVFYVKFYQLDDNQDNALTKEEFLEYDEGRLSRKMVERIFMSNVAGGERMTFWDWVVFLLADIDKTSPAAMEYWFPVLDSDNDGAISVADLRELWNDSLVFLITGCYSYSCVCFHSLNMKYALCLEECEISAPVRWADIRTQLMDLLGQAPWNLMTLKKHASDKLAHLLNAFLNILYFYCMDEEEQSTRSEFTNVQNYVLRMSNEMDGE